LFQFTFVTVTVTGVKLVTRIVTGNVIENVTGIFGWEARKMVTLTNISSYSIILTIWHHKMALMVVVVVGVFERLDLHHQILAPRDIPVKTSYHMKGLG
jgi:hypothetical protein